jgi:tetratricopeptide (TPR) repeat protein
LASTPAGKLLPALIGALHQEGAEGELFLEQSDGYRRLFWQHGDLVYLQSDVAGEQFGNYLLRQGILDLPALQELLAPGEGARFGEKVVQWGLMTREERDGHLRTLMTQILLHALEHPVVDVRWEPVPISERLAGDLYFTLDHRNLVWSCLQDIHSLRDLSDVLFAQSDWRWKAPKDLLLSMKDLPLNPSIAYALSFLGPEPLGFETFLSLTELGPDETARLLMSLWALGGLQLIEGEMPVVPRRRVGEAVQPQPPAKAEAPKPPPVPQPPPVSAAAAPPAIPVAAIPVAAIPPTPSSPIPPPRIPDPQITIETIDLDTEEPAERISLAVDGAPPPSPEFTLGPEDDDNSSPLRRARRLFKKAKILILQEKSSEAIRALEQSLKLDPDSPQSYEAWLTLGKLRLGNPAWSTRAVEALQAASRLQAKSAEPWALMGELYLRKGFKANAVGCFKKALELDPSVPIPLELDLEGDGPKEIKEQTPPPTIMGRLGSGLKAMLRREKD